MKKSLNLSEVKKFYNNENCYEIDNGFIVNDFGKYSPNLSFIISKEFDLDDGGNVKDQFRYFDDKDVINNMNIDFKGSSRFMFGDYWVSKKGTKCFKPKDPVRASHIFIEVNWGGCFNPTRGIHPSDASKLKPVYYHKGSSNGGGVGTDYWIFPVGYIHTMTLENDEVIDGMETNKEIYKTSYFSDIIRAENEKTDEIYREAVKNKDIIIPKLIILEDKLKELKASVPENLDVYVYTYFEFREVDFGFGGIPRNIGEPNSHRYTEESVKQVEEYYNKRVDTLADAKIKYEFIQSQKAIFLPQYKRLEDRFNTLGYSMKYYDDRIELVTPSNSYAKYEYSENDYIIMNTRLIKDEDKLAETISRRMNNERILNALRSTSLPEDFYYIFENLEDTTEDIINTAKSIVKAKDLDKDDMDMHELTSCGICRRCDAIYRLLDRAGKYIGLPLIQSSQSASMKLAHYIAGIEN